jgi:Rha family phage regulatory protein
MGDLIPINGSGNARVFWKDGKPMTTSRDVAEEFEKNHFDVLDKIEKLECSQEFRDSNFTVSSYQSSQNRTMPMYELTRDGFMFLVMGFTGSKAAKSKEGFINAFNRLLEEHERNVQLTAKHGLMLERMLEESIENIKWQREQTAAIREATEAMAGNIIGVRSDVNNVRTEVAVLRKDVDELKQIKPRKQLPKKTQTTHIEFLADEYLGKCPMCMDQQILGPNQMRLDVFAWDHHRGRHEVALDKTWPLCSRCNNRKSNGGIPDGEAEALFTAYHVRLKRWLQKSALPLFVGERIAQ